MNWIKNLVGVMVCAAFVLVPLAAILPFYAYVAVGVVVAIFSGLWFAAAEAHREKEEKQHQEKMALAMHEVEVRLRIEAEQKRTN